MFPVLLRIGPLTVYSYGVMLAGGFALATAWTVRQARRLGYSQNLVLDLALWVLLAGVVGARVVYVALEPSLFRSFADVFRTWQGGLSFHGGLIGALAAVFLFAKRRGIAPLAVADLLSPGTALGYAVARIGCFLNGCCYGVPTSLPWAVRFPSQLDAHQHSAPSHPTQLYATAANLVIFGVLSAMLGRRPRTGTVFAAYLAMYSVYRFLIEFLRAGATARYLFVTGSGIGLTYAQVASLVILAAAGVLWRIQRIRCVREGKTHEDPT